MKDLYTVFLDDQFEGDAWAETSEDAIVSCLGREAAYSNAYRTVNTWTGKEEHPFFHPDVSESGS